MTMSRKHYLSLDGLRGIAALVVVIYHSMIATPRFATIRLQPGEQVLTPLEQLIANTPLRLFWSGTEAVIVFFVLSGFVLSLPFVRTGSYPAPYFYPRRMLRLYLPAIASLFFAFLMAVLVPRVVIPGASSWVNEHAELPNGPQQVVLGSSLMHGWGGLNLSLWSLRWEVLFSVLLAAFLWFGRIGHKTLWIKIALTIALAALWPLANIFYPNGIFIVVFILGVLMAYNIDLMQQLASRVSKLGWVLLFVAAAILLTYSGIVVALGDTLSATASDSLDRLRLSRRDARGVRGDVLATTSYPLGNTCGAVAWEGVVQPLPDSGSGYRHSRRDHWRPLITLASCPGGNCALPRSLLRLLPPRRATVSLDFTLLSTRARAAASGPR